MVSGTGRTRGRFTSVVVERAAALFANVRNDPGDDTARLVLADWLEEHDESDLGQFLRAGVVASRFRDEPVIEDRAYFDAIVALAGVASWGTPARWLSELGIGPSPLTSTDWLWDNTGDRVTVRIGRVSGVFTRGLLSELVAPLGEWYEFAPVVFAGWPLEGGTVTDVPGLRFHVEAPTVERPEWRLSAVLTVQPRRRRAGAMGILASLGPLPSLRWEAERTFPDRATLADRIPRASVVLVDDLIDAAGALWPSPPNV